MLLKKITGKQPAISLIEVIMAVSIFAMISMSLFTLILMGVNIVRDDQARIDAIAIAQSQMEEIRNVPYENIGTVSGIPAGPFEQLKTIERNQQSFDVSTAITYVDDSFDDVAPVDIVNTDYKQVRVQINWPGQYVKKPVVLVTNIAPEGIETDQGGGTLWIEAYDSSANPLVGANVSIINTEVTPAVNISAITDSNGRYILPGADPSIQSYHVVVTKAGHSISQTYAVDPVGNPNPDPADLSVAEANVTTKIFSIDVLSSLQLHTVDTESGEAAPDVELQVTGSKRIGTDLEGADIPKFDQAVTTDSNGDYALTDIEYDTYSIAIDDAATGIDFAGSAPHLPYVLAPNTTETITIFTAANADQTMLITVENSNEDPQVGASVRVFNTDLSVDITQDTNSAGQTFFTPLTAENYSVEVTQAGYQFYEGDVEVQDDELLTVPLTAL